MYPQFLLGGWVGLGVRKVSLTVGECGVVVELGTSPLGVGGSDMEQLLILY